jgi:hypothetical protein
MLGAAQGREIGRGSFLVRDAIAEYRTTRAQICAWSVNG